MSQLSAFALLGPAQLVNRRCRLFADTVCRDGPADLQPSVPPLASQWRCSPHASPREELVIVQPASGAQAAYR